MSWCSPQINGLLNCLLASVFEVPTFVIQVVLPRASRTVVLLISCVCWPRKLRVQLMLVACREAIFLSRTWLLLHLQFVRQIFHELLCQLVWVSRSIIGGYLRALARRVISYGSGINGRRRKSNGTARRCRFQRQIMSYSEHPRRLASETARK